MRKKSYKSNQKINKIETTNDVLTSRAGITLFAKYLERINVYALLIKHFEFLRKSKKGLEIWKIFKQVFCFLFDGTSRHISYFDKLKKDEGYAAAIENNQKDMLTSHAVKRFFKSFSWICGGLFRKVLRNLFLWRLKIEKPRIIELTLDTMVMDNDEARKREGVQPTYKKKKGFQPLQLIWNGKIVDAIFRGGKKHSNYGKSVIKMITEIVKFIRKEYDSEATIILRLDSGFFDIKNYKAFDELGIVFICTGKMDDTVKNYVDSNRESEWLRYDNGKQIWTYTEFGYKCKSWDKFYRAIYTSPTHDDNDQLLFDFARPDNVILTNIGINKRALENCTDREKEKILNPEFIVKSNHARGKDELPHRGLKDFGFEELPFKRFSANNAFYYCMLICYFLFETFKEDVSKEVIPVVSYATTVRRNLVDIAGKIVKTGNQIILKITKSAMETLKFDKLWEFCQSPVPIPLAQ